MTIGPLFDRLQDDPREVYSTPELASRQPWLQLLTAPCGCDRGAVLAYLPAANQFRLYCPTCDRSLPNALPHALLDDDDCLRAFSTEKTT